MTLALQNIQSNLEISRVESAEPDFRPTICAVMGLMYLNAGKSKESSSALKYINLSLALLISASVLAGCVSPSEAQNNKSSSTGNRFAVADIYEHRGGNIYDLIGKGFWANEGGKVNFCTAGHVASLMHRAYGLKLNYQQKDYGVDLSMLERSKVVTTGENLSDSGVCFPSITMPASNPEVKPFNFAADPTLNVNQAVNKVFPNGDIQSLIYGGVIDEELLNRLGVRIPHNSISPVGLWFIQGAETCERESGMPVTKSGTNEVIGFISGIVAPKQRGGGDKVPALYCANNAAVVYVKTQVHQP